MKKEVNIKELLSGDKKIEEPDRKIYNAIKKRWDGAAKPIDSMGKFEHITALIGAAQGTVDIKTDRKAVVVMCSDNGIVEEGISQSGQEVTLAVAREMGRRNSSVCKMAKKAGLDVIPVDIGINTEIEVEGLLQRKTALGTKNFAKEPAMSYEQALMTIQTGIDIAYQAYLDKRSILCTGEMGIGNTTTSAAITAALMKYPAKETAGKGSGLAVSAMRKKEQVIDEAIKKYDLYNADPLKVLSCVGGFDIAGLTGLIIGGAYYRIPVVTDGVIGNAAALCAVRMFPKTRGYITASHISREPSAEKILKELELPWVIDAGMALGEGTGAVMFCALLDIAMTLYNDTLTFDDINIEAYTRFEEDLK